MKYTIRKLESGGERENMYPLILLRRPDLSKQEFLQMLEEMIAEDYICIGAFDEDNKCVGIGGYYIQTRFYLGKTIQVENLVIAPEFRDKGVGSALIKWIEEKGREQNCVVCVLNNSSSNHAAHKFYHREGYSIDCFHFIKEL